MCVQECVCVCVCTPTLDCSWCHYCTNCCLSAFPQHTLHSSFTCCTTRPVGGPPLPLCSSRESVRVCVCAQFPALATLDSKGLSPVPPERHHQVPVAAADRPITAQSARLHFVSPATLALRSHPVLPPFCTALILSCVRARMCYCAWMCSSWCLCTGVCVSAPQWHKAKTLCVCVRFGSGDRSGSLSHFKIFFFSFRCRTKRQNGRSHAAERISSLVSSVLDFRFLPPERTERTTFCKVKRPTVTRVHPLYEEPVCVCMRVCEKLHLDAARTFTQAAWWPVIRCFKWLFLLC